MTSLGSLTSAGRALGAAATSIATTSSASSGVRAAGPAAAGRTGQAAGAAVLPARAAKAGAAAGRKPAAGRKKTSTSKPGYAKTSLPAEFAFLRDPKLSIEEKLSRFCGLIMAKAEKDLLAQMERMAPGAKTSAAGGTGGTGGAAPKKKSGGLWGAVKILLPQVGIAATLLGDAATKKLVQQVSGPVLAAAATALGLPQLAPLALQAGALLGKVVTDDQKGAAEAVGAAIDGVLRDAGAGALSSAATGGAAAKAATVSASPGTSGTTSTAKAAGDAPRSEKADQLELQRLMEREKETFTLLSNILRMNHEARMVSVQNIR